ncbi:MAG: hypothetical protein WKF81_01255 [Thermomicrobiales bacterium]
MHRSVRARVFGTTTANSFVAIPFGQLIGGFMAEWLRVQLYIGLVAGIYVAVVMSFLVTPVLHEMDRGRDLSTARFGQGWSQQK